MFGERAGCEEKKRFFHRQEGRRQMFGRRGAGLGGSDPNPHGGWVIPPIEGIVPSPGRGPTLPGVVGPITAEGLIPSPSSPARGRPLATTGTTRCPLPPVPGQPSRAAGHPDSQPRPPTLPSVPLPAAAQRRARTQSPGGGVGRKRRSPARGAAAARGGAREVPGSPCPR